MLNVYSAAVPYTVICISATDGSRALEVANVVGDQLGLRVIEEEIVMRAANEAGVHPQDIADVEQRKTVFSKLLDRMVVPGAARDPEFVRSRDAQVTAGMIGVVLPRNPGTRRDDDELRGLIRSAIDEFMATGDAVIFSHAASHSLAGRKGVLRVMITATPSTRSARLAESLKIAAKDADAAVKRGDGNRADYLKRFYGVEQESPTQYDIVLNTDNLTPEEAAGAIVALAAAGATD